MNVVTPAQVEQQLLALSREYNDAYEFLKEAEITYSDAKSAYEIKAARTRMTLTNRALEGGRKITVQEKEDEALILCAMEYTQLNAAEAVVKAARANTARLRTQIDIVRSIGTSVRAAMEL